MRLLGPGQMSRLVVQLLTASLRFQVLLAQVDGLLEAVVETRDVRRYGKRCNELLFPKSLTGTPAMNISVRIPGLCTSDSSSGSICFGLSGGET